MKLTAGRQKHAQNSEPKAQGLAILAGSRLATRPAPEVSLARMQDRAVVRDDRALGLVEIAEANHSRAGWAAVGLVGASVAAPLVLPLLGAIGTWSGVAQ